LSVNKTIPLVTIVIPVFNGARYLAEAIDSALAQTYKHIEVVVINDGSTDGGNTESVALSFGERIRYYHKPNGHVASALNFGIRHMRGEYFSWLSHDDLYKPTKIETQIRAIARLGPKTVVYGDFETLDQVSQVVTPIRVEDVPPESFRYWIARTSALHGCTLLIPKLCLEAAGLFNESLRTTQDYDMWFRMARFCRFIHLPGIVVTSRQHSEQGTHALRDVAVAESDRLLTGFVRELSRGELVGSSGKRLPSAYTKLAATMRRRGFPVAYEAALKLSLAAAREEPPVYRVAAAIERALTLRPQSLLQKARPLLAAVRRRLLSRATRASAIKDVNPRFSEFYHANVFGGRESRSGEGSSLEQTATIREEMPKLLKEIGARTFLDAPCGDFNWIQHVDLGVETYLGADVVEELVAENQRRYGSESRQFSCVNLIEDEPPAADVVFCRDCLVHLSFEQAKRVLQNFQRSGSRYVLTTTFVDRAENVDLKGRDVWRTLNLEMPPFNFPEPLKLINENCTEQGGAYSDKCLGLWRLSDLKLD
jgi:hypothetical protein